MMITIIIIIIIQDYLQNTIIDKINIRNFITNSKLYIIQEQFKICLKKTFSLKIAQELEMPAMVTFILQSKECSILL